MNFIEGRLESKADQLAFDGGPGLLLPVPADRKPALAGHAGKPVVLGLRPEHLGSAEAERQPGAPRIRAIVDVVEHMGSETYVHLLAGALPLVSRVDPHSRFEPGQPAEPAVRMDLSHFFDPATGLRIN
jgi:multiple sugar transport system ATP-binding protein